MFCQTAEAQNLVPNCSFENMRNCPIGFNQQQLTSIEGWGQVKDGTPDYFNACSSKMGVPENLFGTQEAQDGVAYAGLVTYSGNKRDYREFLQTKLTEPLTAGALYCIEVYVAPGAKSEFVTDGLGISLTAKGSDNLSALSAALVLNNPRLNFIDRYGEWVLISAIFEAKGGENYLTIGNFKKDREFSVLKRNTAQNERSGNNWAYIFVDNVSITQVKNKEECSCTAELIAKQVHDPPLQLNELKEIELRNVLFDFDESHLTSMALKDLESVADLLRRNKTYFIEVAGHTDIVGREGYNLDLSRKRAESVLGFLEKKGVAGKRLTIGFFGSEKPVADNETPEGRAQNRRVEFRILEHKYEWAY